jgi:hypothetical protein
MNSACPTASRLPLHWPTSRPSSPHADRSAARADPPALDLPAPLRLRCRPGGYPSPSRSRLRRSPTYSAISGASRCGMSRFLEAGGRDRGAGDGRAGLGEGVQSTVDATILGYPVSQAAAGEALFSFGRPAALEVTSVNTTWNTDCDLAAAPVAVRGCGMSTPPVAREPFSASRAGNDDRGRRASRILVRVGSTTGNPWQITPSSGAVAQGRRLPRPLPLVRPPALRAAKSALDPASNPVSSSRSGGRGLWVRGCRSGDAR